MQMGVCTSSTTMLHFMPSRACQTLYAPSTSGRVADTGWRSRDFASYRTRRLERYRHAKQNPPPTRHMAAAAAALGAEGNSNSPGAQNGDSKGQPPAPSPEERAEMREALERSTKLINDMMEEIGSGLFVETAASYLTDEPLELSEAEAVRDAVLKRIEYLDANFLGALEAYIRAASTRGDAQTTNMLEAIWNEVLRQVSQRLPPAARVLDFVLAEPEKVRREDIIRTAMGGGAAQVPGASADALLTASTQFIDDMEEQPVVIDRHLLARLVLAREEVRALDLAAGFTGDEGERCAAFLKELVKVGEPARRVALLARALEDDWDGAAPRPKDMNSGQPDYVRPGRLLTTLQTMQAQLAIDEQRNSAVLRRLEDIKNETLAVLDKMQLARAARGVEAPATTKG